MKRLQEQVILQQLYVMLVIKQEEIIIQVGITGAINRYERKNGR